MIFVLVAGCVVGAWCGHIARQKHLNPFGYALLGLLLPVIGPVVVMCEPARPAPTCAGCGGRSS